MAIFRFYRGELSDSLKTSVIVKNKDELKNILEKTLFGSDPITDMLIEKYGDGFDYRIGWYTYIVNIKYLSGIESLPMGYLSENLYD